jgi:acyl-CoA dehydrogenase
MVVETRGHRGAEHRAQASYGAMPTTDGMNFYSCDPSLETTLRRLLSPEDYDRAQPHLDELGELAGGRLGRLATVANANPPILVPFDAAGRRVDEIRFHPAYEEMEQIGFGRFGLAAMSHRDGVLGWPERVPHVVKYALGYLFTHAEFGLMCPISVTDSTSRMLRLFGDSEIQTRYLPSLTATDMRELKKGSQWVTEKSGGSDVGASETVARYDGGAWRLYGDKWFCSVADGEYPLTLARPEGAPAGTRGLAMFLVPHHLDDGSLNAYRINRLKDKLGTRSMASGEVTLDGATAYPVGPLENGFRQMAEMINVSRLSNAMRAAALMRRSYLEALTHARGRMAFGRPLSDLPLLRETLVDLLVDAEAGAAAVFHAGAVLDRADAGSTQDKALIRLLTPLTKFQICKRARWSAGEAMEVRGGNGYIEEWVNARLVRDSYLGSIWEGSTNVVMLDVGRALSRERAGDPFFSDIDRRMDAVADPAVARLAGVVRTLAADVRRHAARLDALTGAARDLLTGRVAVRMAHVQAASTLIDEAAYAATHGLGYGRLVIAARYLLANIDHGAAYFDPVETDDDLFRALVDWEILPPEAAAALVARCEALVW